MNQRKAQAARLGVFSLVMITIGSVDSIRNLPASALFGSQLIFFYLLAALLFFLPSAFIAAELSSSQEQRGGIYDWVKHAFGPQIGLLAVWLQWTENIIWYPTILSFIAATMGYLVSPALANSKVFIITVILCSFWGVTLVNLRGIRTSALFANVCAIFGLLIPMLLIIALGIYWVLSGHPLQIHFSTAHLLPNFKHQTMWLALTAIMLSMMGIEIATVHSQDVKNPGKAYPLAMLICTVILLITLLGGALSIAVTVPHAQLSPLYGIMQDFNTFFTAYHMKWLLPVVAIMLIIGGMGGVNNWVIAPTRGLFIAAQDGCLPALFKAQNKRQAPSKLLFLQAVIVTIVTFVFTLLPSVNAAYWLLTAMATQQYLLMYILMFAAGIRQRYLKEEVSRGYRIPGGNWVMWLLGGMGIISSIAVFAIGFIPPANTNIGSVDYYEGLLLAGLVILTVPPFIFYRCCKRR